MTDVGEAEQAILEPIRVLPVSESMGPLSDDGYCFGCGPSNPIGLRLTFQSDLASGLYQTQYTPRREHQGWADRAHGGLISLVFDEVLSRVVLIKKGHYWVTAELTVRYLKPALLGVPLTFVAKIVRDTRRLCITSAEARTEDGTLIATAQSKLLPVSAT